MHQLQDFCNHYLPDHFARKFKDGNLKSPFFNFKNQNNVFQLTAKIFSLIDLLQNANPSLQPTKLIKKYFMFEISDFQLACKDFRTDQEDKGRQAVRQILKKMSKQNRQAYQIFLRLIYLYFDSKQTVTDNNKNQIRKQYIEVIPKLYIDLKMKIMTDDVDAFGPVFFMEYIIRLLLDMNPTKKFNKIVDDLMKQCDFSQAVQQNITRHIKQIQTVQQLKMALSINKNKLIPHESNKMKIIPHQENNSSKNLFSEAGTKNSSKQKNQTNQSTPVKQKSANKMQANTLQTSQKKQNIIKKQNDLSTLESLKTSLKMHKKGKTPFKQRTLYMRSKYLIPRKTQSIFDQNSSTASNFNIQNDELFLYDMSRTYSSRCIEVTENQEGDFLAGATPKPKKKMKLDQSFSLGTSNDKGNFVRSLY